MSNRKVALIGGGGVRTPLVIFGINESAANLGVDEMVLYDLDQNRAEVMCKLGQALIARERGTLRLRVASTLEDAIAGAAFVLTAIRVGGIKARAIDERISIDNGYPGQETTGPGGVAMGLRTTVVAIECARLVERLSPDAWMINFTNPAGLITQAISHHTKVRFIASPSLSVHGWMRFTANMSVSITWAGYVGYCFAGKTLRQGSLQTIMRC